MPFATKMFRFSFEPGEPIMFPIKSFSWKESYDKYYVLDGKEPMSRYEVALTAIKHGMLISTQQTCPLEHKAKSIYYKGWKSTADGNSHEAPEYFGMWTGKFIPVMTAFQFKSGVREYTQEEASTLAFSWSEEFFEQSTVFWLEMLMGKAHLGFSEYARTGRTVWVAWHMDIMWIPVYQQLRSEGLQESLLMREIISDISQYVPAEENT